MASAPDRPLPADAAGWLLRAPRSPVDLDAMLARFGEVYRYPVPPGEVASAMAAGQPCFLVRTDRAKVVGLWAIGSVAAPVLIGSDPSGAETWEAEVDLLRLEKPIATAALAAHPVLAESPFTFTDDGPSLHPLTRAEVRAVESLDFWLVDPTDEQRAALDRLLAEEDAAAG